MRKWRRPTEEDDVTTLRSAWLCTFNDMITLLLVFFVLVFSMGTIDGSRMIDFRQALQYGLGVFSKDRQATVSQSPKETSPKKAEVAQQIKPGQDRDDTSHKTLVTQMAQRINRQEGMDLIQIGERGQIRMDNSLLFRRGKADLQPGGLSILMRLAQEFREIPHSIRIEGHTDNIPIQTSQFPSNWELSAARAVSVVKYFAQKGRIAPERLSAAGYADAKPVRPNTSSANRASNRRVEIVLLKGNL